MNKFNKWLNTPIVMTKGERIRDDIILILVIAFVSNLPT